MDLTNINDPQAMRLAVLEALAERAEADHARRVALDLETPARLAVVVAVTVEAAAYWAVESSHGLDVAGYRELADDTYRIIGEKIPGLTVAAMTPERRARERAQVVADMRGPSDDMDQADDSRAAFEAQERIELTRSRAAAQRSGALRVFTVGGQEIEYDENDAPRPKYQPDAEEAPSGETDDAR